MITVYIYLLATLADWEIGPVSAELNSRRFFKNNAPELIVKTVARSKEPVKTMGGLTLIPDCTIDEIKVSEKTVLILPGANTWSEAENAQIIQKASDLLSRGGTVCAICGATVALANAGLLNDRPHTSNGKGFLEMFCPDYKGQKFYVNQPAVKDGNLITGSATGSLLWAKLIIEKLDVFKPETLEAWYAYFSTGKQEHFFAMMRSVN
ncbi:glutamine amidotransferase [Treponema ruminis]|uniref:Putative intracellular protease/amidase n=1 Tax=Treponema ruminis TaxID=744515 RepID=A0A7W8GA45_9SPIR|nr:type 1 glutamine amidotransferase family protein [Treponema ruminis]MBB5226673.1 putative intracellular protease/amidase [Treponema ruminis]QSI02099.1 glutamine amidotransferase [Treponema ruminis]